MIHDLDVVLSIVKSPVSAIDAVGVPVLTPRIDIANVRLRFESGCIVNLTASRISRDRTRKIRFFQPESYVAIDYAAQEVEMWRLVRQPAGMPTIEGGPVAVASDEPLKCELEDFVDSIRTRRPPQVTGEDGRRALSLAQGNFSSDGADDESSCQEHMTATDALLERAIAGEPLSPADIDAIHRAGDVLALGMAADEVRRRRHGARTTFARVQVVPIETVSDQLTLAPAAGEIRVTVRSPIWIVPSAPSDSWLPVWKGGSRSTAFRWPMSQRLPALTWAGRQACCRLCARRASSASPKRRSTHRQSSH